MDTDVTSTSILHVRVYRWLRDGRERRASSSFASHACGCRQGRLGHCLCSCGCCSWIFRPCFSLDICSSNFGDLAWFVNNGNSVCECLQVLFLVQALHVYSVRSSCCYCSQARCLYRGAVAAIAARGFALVLRQHYS